MKRAILFVAALTSAAMLVSLDADAKRLGGGRNLGTPRDTVTQRQATPPVAATPAQPAAPASAAVPKANPTPMTPPVAQPAWKRWMGPIAGIAAGLGIAALMSHLGLSEAFGNFLVIALIVIAAIVLLRLLFRRKESAQGIQYRGSELAGAGAGAAGGMAAGQPGAFGGAAAAGAPAEAPAKPYPADFDVEPFLRQAKINFVRLQRAYDEADASTLRDVMTPEMYAEISKELETRGAHQATEVVTLNADIVEVTTERDAHWASVRFTGLLREDNKPTPEPFDEVWNLTKPLAGDTGWLLAGIQQMQ